MTGLVATWAWKMRVQFLTQVSRTVMARITTFGFRLVSRDRSAVTASSAPRLRLITRSQISMFIPQSGPVRTSLVAR